MRLNMQQLGNTPCKHIKTLALSSRVNVSGVSRDFAISSWREVVSKYVFSSSKVTVFPLKCSFADGKGLKHLVQ
ncbi:hypothetical protein EXN66_Car018423 [Channa argus]|uniref:Uncharacterized protein n=1 Tax=Channa argus TaxID=215402 RepID=A0A6G1QJK9_CHAAH|nr:hypothetical protein EXN66_Car018423 [Channa argus]